MVGVHGTSKPGRRPNADHDSPGFRFTQVDRVTGVPTFRLFGRESVPRDRLPGSILPIVGCTLPRLRIVRAVC